MQIGTWPDHTDWRCEPADKTPARAQAARSAQQQHRPTAMALWSAVRCAWCCTLYTCGYTQMRQESHRVDTEGTQQEYRWINPPSMPPCWCMNAQSKAHGTNQVLGAVANFPAGLGSGPSCGSYNYAASQPPQATREANSLLSGGQSCACYTAPLHRMAQRNQLPLQTKNCTTYLHRIRLSITRPLQLRPASACTHRSAHAAS